ncbi:hypothetical protein [Microcoleus sp. herbarium14]|uniref:hypothetical protein n=1 Tax=Microcoleus sp. herbarium14 TaxID=3055439 RepID=UPI002FD12B02
MKTVMISGSRSIRRLPSAAIESLDCIIELELPVIIGDAPGVDSLVQQYLRSKNYQKVTVYFASKAQGSGKPRNTHGYPTAPVPGSYGDRDAQMCSECSYGLAIWDGCSKGTAANIKRVPKTKVIRC